VETAGNESRESRIRHLPLEAGDGLPLAELRAEVRELLGDVDPDVLVDVELVCTELATNALEHAAGPRAVRLDYRRRAGVVRVEVDDASPETMPVVGVSSRGEHRGRGLLIVSRVGRWGVDRRGPAKTVWAELDTH